MTCLIRWQEVRPGVFRSVREVESVTACLVAGGEHVLMVDAGWSPEEGAGLAEESLSVIGRPVDRVVVTHGHYDHWFGLGGLAGIESWGHAWLAEPDAALQAAAEMFGPVDPRTVPAPTHLVNVASAFDLGGRRIELCHFATGHHCSDLVVLIPDADVIIVGDLVEPAGYPAFGPGASLAGWLDALDAVLALCGPETLMIPGHGDPVGRDHVAELREQLGLVQAQARILVRRGTDLKVALAHVDDDLRRGSWPFDAATIKAVLPIAYAELAAASTVDDSVVDDWVR